MSERGIVEKLRAPAYWMSGSNEGHEGENDAPRQAADEIDRLRAEAARLAAENERLRAALREIDTACNNPGRWSEIVMERIIERVEEIARAALQDKSDE